VAQEAELAADRAWLEADQRQQQHEAKLTRQAKSAFLFLFYILLSLKR